MNRENQLINFFFRAITFRLFKWLYAYNVDRLNDGYPPMYVYPRDIAGWATVAWGVWERWNIESSNYLINKFLNLSSQQATGGGRPVLGLDIGANLGIYTLNLAKKFDKFVAVEASPVVSKVLEANILTNQLDDRVDLQVIALGDDEKIHEMNVNLSSSGLSSFQAETKGNIKKVKIQMHRGDTVLDNHYPNYRLAYIKCDVEGYELNVMKGLKKWLQKDFPLIQIEHDGRKPESAEVLKFLNSLGYRYMYAREGLIPRYLRPVFGSVGIWPKLVRIENVKPRFYQAIWLSNIDINT